MPKSFPTPKFLTLYASERDFYLWINCKRSQQPNIYTIAKEKKKKKYISNIIKDTEELWMQRELNKLKFLSELTLPTVCFPRSICPFWVQT